jgi:hypothetical protein
MRKSLEARSAHCKASSGYIQEDLMRLRRTIQHENVSASYRDVIHLFSVEVGPFSVCCVKLTGLLWKIIANASA